MPTPSLNLPYIIASQAQKEVTHADALNLLDALVQSGVVSRSDTTPPGSPLEGNVYLVAATANGDWAGEENHLAQYIGGAWQFMTPKAGWKTWVNDEQLFIVFDGSNWQEMPLVASSSTVSAVPSAATAGRLLYVSDESGGATLAFADGTNWRRVTDRAVIS